MIFGQLTPTLCLYKVVCGASKERYESHCQLQCLFYVSWRSDSGAEGTAELAVSIFGVVLENTNVKIVAAHSTASVTV